MCYNASVGLILNLGSVFNIYDNKFYALYGIRIKFSVYKLNLHFLFSDNISVLFVPENSSFLTNLI